MLDMILTQCVLHKNYTDVNRQVCEYRCERRPLPAYIVGNSTYRCSSEVRLDLGTATRKK